MSVGFWQIVIIGALVVLMFGRGKVSELMGDVAKGIKSFKTGLADDDAARPTTIPHTETVTVEPAETKRRAS